MYDINAWKWRLPWWWSRSSMSVSSGKQYIHRIPNPPDTGDRAIRALESYDTFFQWDYCRTTLCLILCMVTSVFLILTTSFGDRHDGGFHEPNSLPFNAACFLQ